MGPSVDTLKDAFRTMGQLDQVRRMSIHARPAITTSFSCPAQSSTRAAMCQASLEIPSSTCRRPCASRCISAESRRTQRKLSTKPSCPGCLTGRAGLRAKSLVIRRRGAVQLRRAITFWLCVAARDNLGPRGTDAGHGPVGRPADGVHGRRVGVCVRVALGFRLVVIRRISTRRTARTGR